MSDINEMNQHSEVEEQNEQIDEAVSGEKKKKRGLHRFIGIIIVVAIIVGFKFYNKSKAGDDIRSQTIEIVQAMPGYDENQSYIDSILEPCFETAFEVSYDMGSRRRSAKFDQDKYITTLFDNLRVRSKQDGKEELARRFKVYKMVLIRMNNSS